MGFVVKSTLFLSIFAILQTLSFAAVADDAFKQSLQTFSHNVFQELVESHRNRNIIYSPFCIQTCLTMARMGADGETAQEMDNVLGITSELTLEAVADNYFDILNRYNNSNILHLANKIFVMDGHQLNNEVNEVMATKFLAPLYSLDFRQNREAASAINEWVQSKTSYKIRKFISYEMINPATRLIVLSAIHFKGEWEKPFLHRKTLNRPFYFDENEFVEVPTMYKVDNVLYGRFPELNAHAIRMLYKDSDLSMLIFLPRSRTGLADMEEKLKDIDLDTLTQEMNVEKVAITLPKFKAEFRIDLKSTLRKLGLSRVFVAGEFGKLLKKSTSLSISDVLHMAFIDVSETGTEAAAVTGLGFQPVSMPHAFRANHPFHYLIVNDDNTILFEGNVVKL